jgi:rhomboid protease GluP
MSLALSPDTLSVGASGAIFGLLGALGVFYFTNRTAFGKAGTFYLRQIAFVALINLALGLRPGIDNWGHLGGLIVGAALTWFVGPVISVGHDEITGQRIVRDERPWENAWPAALVGGAVLLILAIALMI